MVEPGFLLKPDEVYREELWWYGQTLLKDEVRVAKVELEVEVHSKLG